MQKRKNEEDPAKAIEVAIFQSGQAILSQGQQNPFFLVILSGRVILSKNGNTIRTLSEQDIFGLESLLSKQPSHYSAHAACQCRIAKYGLQTLDHLIRESPRMIQGVLLSTLQQLTHTTLNLLDLPRDLPEDNVRIRFYEDGELILDEETKGWADICRLISTQSGLQVTRAGREVTRINKPGEFFGRPVSRSHACVRSIGRSVVEKYGADDLDILIRDHPESARRIMQALIERLEVKEPGTE